MAIHLNHLHTPLNPTKLNLNPALLTLSLRFSTLQVHAFAGGKAQQLIQSGQVRPIRPKDAATAIDNEGYVLLDIRPEWEREKAHVSGSLHVPLFVEDKDYGPIMLLKKWVHFGYIGLWTGQCFTMINSKFVEEVAEEVPNKGTKLLVACGEGLRSLMAVSKLHEEGYSNIGWLAGGFNRSKDEDFVNVEGSEKLQYATIGGASYYFLQILLLFQAVANNKS